MFHTNILCGLNNSSQNYCVRSHCDKTGCLEIVISYILASSTKKVIQMVFPDNGLKIAQLTGPGQDIGSNCITELIQLRVTFYQLASVKSSKPVNKTQFQSGKTSKALIAVDLLCLSDNDGNDSKVVSRPLLRINDLYPTPFQPQI